MFTSGGQAPSKRSPQFVTAATTDIRWQADERSIQMHIREVEDSHNSCALSMSCLHHWLSWGKLLANRRLVPLVRRAVQGVRTAGSAAGSGPRAGTASHPIGNPFPSGDVTLKSVVSANWFRCRSTPSTANSRGADVRASLSPTWRIFDRNG